jgi:hypothetical protein
MKKRVDRRSVARLMAASVVGLAGFGVSHSHAAVIVNGVVIDVRATQLNGAPVADPKYVIVGAGDVVTFNLFALVTGTNGLDDDGFQAINGAIRSSTGGLMGNLSAQLLAPFNGAGSQVGTTIDVDSDGDLDVSGANPALSGGYFNPRNGAGFSTDGTRISSDTEEFVIGGATFSISASANADSHTIVNYFQHRTSNGANNLPWGTFLIDSNNGGTSPRNPNNTVIGSADGVTVEVLPEPTALAFPALAAVGLLPRRKKNHA